MKRDVSRRGDEILMEEKPVNHVERLENTSKNDRGSDVFKMNVEIYYQKMTISQKIALHIIYFEPHFLNRIQYFRIGELLR